jgi:hypothetical protein
MAKTPPQAASSANRVAAATRHHSRSRMPSRKTPRPPITLGRSRPRPKTKLDSPARSPLGSGATSSGFVGRRIDCDAAVIAAVIACCCRTSSAPAVTIVTAPLGGTINAPALACERTL